MLEAVHQGRISTRQAGQAGLKQPAESQDGTHPVGGLCEDWADISDAPSVRHCEVRGHMHKPCLAQIPR